MQDVFFGATGLTHETIFSKKCCTWLDNLPTAWAVDEVFYGNSPVESCHKIFIATAFTFEMINFCLWDCICEAVCRVDSWIDRFKIRQKPTDDSWIVPTTKYSNKFLFSRTDYRFVRLQNLRTLRRGELRSPAKTKNVVLNLFRSYAIKRANAVRPYGI